MKTAAVMTEYVRPFVEESSTLDEEWRTAGTSMLPFIPPGSRLHLKEISKGNEFEIGAIVCYLSSDSKFVAHRIVGFKLRDGKRLLEIRGDALDGCELVEPEAVLGVVARVSVGPFSYETDSTVGKGVARLTLFTPRLVRTAARAARLVIVAGSRLKTLSRS